MKKVLSFVAACCLFTHGATADDSQIRIIESTINTDSSTPSMISINSPEGDTIPVRIDSSDKNRLIQLHKADKNTIVSFEGHIVVENDKKIFTVSKWEERTTGTPQSAPSIIETD